MASVSIEPAPYRNPLVTRDGLMTSQWVRWNELALIARVQQGSPTVLPQSGTSGQSASVAPTPLLPSVQAGLYRVTYYARVTTPATSSSSLEISIIWTDDTVVCTQTSPAATGNTITTVLSGQVIVLADAGSPISYSTTYATSGATAMVYKSLFLVEQLG